MNQVNRQANERPAPRGTGSTRGTVPPRRIVLFAVFTLFLAVLFRTPLSALLQFSLEDRYQSHLALIPLISLFLLYAHRERFFGHAWRGSGYGCALLGFGLFLRLLGSGYPPNPGGIHLSLAILSFVLSFAGGFALFFGAEAARAAVFPLAFLAYMTPIPALLLDPLITWLQDGTTFVTDLLFGLFGVPATRDGYVFRFREDWAIEVAKECSGIRSFIVLVVLATLAGWYTLRRTWTRVLFVAAVVPVALFKNAVRVVALSLGSTYVDRSIIDSPLHTWGGKIVFVVALVGLAFVLSALRKLEDLQGRRDGTREDGGGAPDHSTNEG